MSATLQSQAVAIANQLIGIGQQVYNVQQQINQSNGVYGQLSLSAVLAALPTCAVNADGSLGTADGSPNPAHVVDTRVVENLSRTISANDLASLSTFVAAVSLLAAGSAVTQQGQAPQLLAKLISG